MPDPGHPGTHLDASAFCQGLKLFLQFLSATPSLEGEPYRKHPKIPGWNWEAHHEDGRNWLNAPQDEMQCILNSWMVVSKCAAGGMQQFNAPSEKPLRNAPNLFLLDLLNDTFFVLRFPAMILRANVSVSQLAVQLLLQSLWMQISTFVISCLIAWPCGQAKKSGRGNDGKWGSQNTYTLWPYGYPMVNW